MTTDDGNQCWKTTGPRCLRLTADPVASPNVQTWTAETWISVKFWLFQIQDEFSNLESMCPSLLCHNLARKSADIC